MIDNLKVYLLEVVVPKYIPMAVIGAFSALGAYLVAHSSVLEPYGVTYGMWPLQWSPTSVPSGPVILIELATLQAKFIPLVGAAFAVLMVAIKHHGMAAINGTPQSGDVRKTTATPIEGGQRAEDPPKGESK